MATYPSLVMAQQLAEVVKARLGTAYVVGQDANGDPTVAFGPGTAASVSAFVRIKPRNAQLVYDIVGHGQPQYGKPHKAEICIEGINATTGANPAGDALPTVLLAELARIGVRIELYRTANGTAPSLSALGTILTNVAAGTDSPEATWEDLYNPIAATM